MLPIAAPENNLHLELVPPGCDQPIRVVGTPENPLWVLSDLCGALGIANPRAAVASYTDDEKGVHRLSTLGGPQNVLVVTEIGLYRLIFRSDKPSARALQKWVFSEVLPSIRKYGCYPPPENPPEPTALVLRELASQREVNQALLKRLECVEARLKQMDGEEIGYVTLAGYCRMKGIRLSEYDAGRFGRELTKIHRKGGIKLGYVPDKRWGTVNAYRLDELEKFFSRKRLDY